MRERRLACGLRHTNREALRVGRGIGRIEREIAGIRRTGRSCCPVRPARFGHIDTGSQVSDRDRPPFQAGTSLKALSRPGACALRWCPFTCPCSSNSGCAEDRGLLILAAVSRNVPGLGASLDIFRLDRRAHRVQALSTRRCDCRQRLRSGRSPVRSSWWSTWHDRR